MESYKVDLVRFRLIGPRSHALLVETLKPVLTFDEGVEKNEAANSKPGLPEVPVSIPPGWWKGDLRQHMLAHSNLLSRTLHCVKSASSPAQVCKGSVLGMTVFDPRLFTPSKRTDKVSKYYPKKKNGYLLQSRSRNWDREEGLDSDSNSCMESDDEREVDSDGSEMEEGQCDLEELHVELEQTSTGDFQPSSSSSQQVSSPNGFQSTSLDFPPDVAFSPIWDSNIRDVVSRSKVPDHLLNLQRSKQLVRPSEEDLQSKSSRIPVLLVHQSLGPDQRSGWDLILPSNWGMAFWVSFIYHGARACGMRELKKCSLEAQTLHFPADYPDTVACQQYSSEQRQQLEAKYQRCPPDKRRNYGKLLIRQPFCCPWSDIVSAWSQDSTIKRILPPPQIVNKDQVTELHTPSKRMKLSSNHESVLRGSNLDTETQDILEEEAPRPRKRSLGNVVATHEVPPTWYVLRSHDILSCLHHFIGCIFSNKKTRGRCVPGFNFASDSVEDSRFFLTSLRQFQIDEHLQSCPSALLAVKFETNQRGTITDRATISLPTAKDLQLYAAGVGNSRAYSGPKEELNQRGLTVVDRERIFIGISSLSRKEMKEVKRKRAKRRSDKQMNSECAMLSVILGVCDM